MSRERDSSLLVWLPPEPIAIQGGSWDIEQGAQGVGVSSGIDPRSIYESILTCTYSGVYLYTGLRPMNISYKSVRQA